MLKVFEIRMMIFGPKGRGEVVGGWRSLHNEELHHILSDQIKEGAMGR
jgi:hypothetical protein